MTAQPCPGPVKKVSVFLAATLEASTTPVSDYSGRDSWTLSPVAEAKAQVSSNSQPFAGLVYGARVARVLRCQVPSGKTDHRTRRTNGSHHPVRWRTFRVAVVHRTLIVRPAGYILLCVPKGTGELSGARDDPGRGPLRMAQVAGERLYAGLCSRRFTATDGRLWGKVCHFWGGAL